MKAVYC